MDYPFWDTGLAYGWLMAGIAVIHVFVSHFAIGGGLYLVVAEARARKKDDTASLGFLQGLSKFFVLTTLVFGALTGVGIWFVIGLLNPAATELLIHNFVWGWATEWCFFIIEILAAIIYLYGWKSMSAKSHMTVGWIYFGAAWMSLFIINGILSFMLTPGDWIITGNFWDGFFNPTFFSSLVLRTGVCVMLAGLYALTVVSVRKSDDFKKRTVSYNAWWSIVGLAIMVPSLYWYWASIPANITQAALDMMPTPMISWGLSFKLVIAVAVMVLLFGLLLRKAVSLPVALIMMALGLTWFGSFEFFRESLRKPFIVTDYMYGNGMEVAKTDKYLQEGLLANMKFRTGDDGADLFRHSCRSCHTVDSYKALKPAYDGMDEAFIANTLPGLHVMNGNMPPFLGNQEEAQLLASHLYKETDHRPVAEIYGLSGAELGRKVYDLRCGKCHVFGGFNDKAATLLTLGDQDVLDLLAMAGDIAEEMPPFTGDSTEAAAMVEFIKFKKQEAEGGAQ